MLLSTYREVLWNLVTKNLKAKYAGSVLGMLWAFINPLLLALIISFVFTNIFKASSGNFYLFILSGMLPWTFLSGSLQESAMSIPANAALLRQFPLPREIIPLSVVLANFILLLFGFFAVIPLFLMADPGMIFMLPLLIAALVLLFVFTLGLSLLLSAVCVNSRDITHILNTFLMFWLWLTPVFYSIDMVPAGYRVMVDANPAHPFIILFRHALLRDTSGSSHELITGLMLSLLVLAAGTLVFSRKEKGFLKRI